MKLDLEAEDLRPLIEQVVAAVLDRLRAAETQAGGRLGYREAEAAELLGLRPHQLRDARRRGEIHATRVGKVNVYPRGELLRLLSTEEK
ncbi:MAG: helix-turn-helix domain-containing protein [Pirellulales bacterium]|nr:helix-turn-helix domain-containing protein [Pirellulales bacterium]